MKSNRYNFFKRCYPNYLILIVKNKQLISYGIDKKILEYLNIEKIREINKFKINYIILENINIINKKEFLGNNYRLYYKRLKITKLIIKICNNLNLTNALSNE